MNTFLISDLHLGHKGVTHFTNADGSKLRPWDNTEDMDEALVEKWNNVVRPKDRVYVLGDVVINRRALPTIGRLQGEKTLVLGNHDVFRTEEYMQYFKNVRGVWELDGYVLTHVPVHPSSLERWKGNLHGHLHSGRVMLPGRFGLEGEWIPEEIDPRYLCVCVEQPYVNYTPIPFEEVKKLIKEQ